jgi:glycosyltransferase involved in cell wall biosynthesis
MQNKKHKIALVGYQLSSGGLDRVYSDLSVYLGSQNITVHNIVFSDSISYPYSGDLIILEKMKFSSFKIINKIKTILYLRKHLKKNDFDFVIDFRYRLNPYKELFYSYFVYNKLKTIYTVYSSKIDTYLPKNKFITKYITKNKYTIVCCANEIKKILNEEYNIEKCEVIYCSVDINTIEKMAIENVDIDYQYIIAAGRFDKTNVKQFDKLIIAYSNSKLPKIGIHLVLLGDGILKQDFINLSIELGVNNYVHFLGFQKNPFKYFNKAKFLVLCSKYEGQGTVIIEALACKIPVVALDCVCGPSEVIENKQNGLLVENQNFEKLTEAMNLFIEDDNLYNHCKNNSVNSVSRFSIERIGKDWLELLQINPN